MSEIRINNAYEHNLKNISLVLPKEKLVVIAGPSGSGKSSLLFDTIAAESALRIAQLERLNLRQASAWKAKVVLKPKVDSIENLPPLIAFHTSGRAASAVAIGSFLGLAEELKKLLASSGKSSCALCAGEVLVHNEEQIAQIVSQEIARIPNALWAISAVMKQSSNLAIEELVRSGIPEIIYKEEVFASDQTLPVIALADNFEIVIDRLGTSDELGRIGSAIREGLSFAPLAISLRRIKIAGKAYEPISVRLSPNGVCQRCFGTDQEVHFKLIMGDRQLSYDQLTEMSLNVLRKILGSMPAWQQPLLSKVTELCELGLAHLSLSRTLDTLSSGELQRVRLSKQLLFKTQGFLYAIDEPCAGLHPTDSERVIRALSAVRDSGNTVVVSENNQALINHADVLVTLGPASGKDGGYLVPASQILKQSLPQVVTCCAVDTKRSLNIIGAKKHNLKNINVEFALGQFTCVTGVSGSGKTTLVLHTLYPLLEALVKKEAYSSKLLESLGVAQFQGFETVAFVRALASRAEPTSGSVASYLEVSGKLEGFFAELPLSRMRGLKANSFSRSPRKNKLHLCAACFGSGFRTQIEQSWEVEEACEKCGGLGFAPEVLAVRSHGINIAELYNLTFAEVQKTLQPLVPRLMDLLSRLKLDYLSLGQALNSLSRGELQRVRIIKELSKRQKNGVYLFDEPALGLSQHEIPSLLQLFSELIKQGNTIISIEHNPNVIGAAQHVIDIGPGAGEEGGEVVASGTPSEVAGIERSRTAEALRATLNL